MREAERKDIIEQGVHAFYNSRETMSIEQILDKALTLYGESVRKKCVEASKNWSCPHKFGKCSCGTDQEEIAKAIMGVEV